MADLPAPPSPSRRSRFTRAAQVIIVSSVMFSFISYWRTAAVVLCDLASTAYYIGAIVEQAIGPAAPWFILAVMVFSYAVRNVYIESCSLFVRGGVYRIVKEAVGGFFAKLAVSCLMFDYIMTGPISGVTAGQYIIGLALELIHYSFGLPPGQHVFTTGARDIIKSAGSVAICCGVTWYFFRQNVRGIHESSDKAMKIMIATTVMGVVILVWCGVTVVMRGGPVNPLPVLPNLGPKLDPNKPDQPPISPLGWLEGTPLDHALTNLHGPAWLSLLGVLGIIIAFGHSILAMSGEETLAQVYREVESPKLPNFRKAAFVVFVYSLVLTAGISFLAVMLIPEKLRTGIYADNLIGGLAMSVAGPIGAKFVLNGFVVIVGFLILSGAVNTAIIGSNGVLNRVAEDGVMPDWFLKPHPRYGTTHRVLWLIFILQIITILASGGDVIWLGEAYAFGVIWSFVFMVFAMFMLRFKRPGPRDYKLPLNLHIGGVELPIGLALVFIVLLAAATLNLLTKPTATVGGACFTAVLWTVFTVTEIAHEKRRRGEQHTHLDQFNQQVAQDVNAANLRLPQLPFHKLVAIRSPQNLFMLEKALAETDPETTAVVVMTAKVLPTGEGERDNPELDRYDQELMTAVVDRAEKAGKQVQPIIVQTNNPLHAILRTAIDLKAQEVIIGASNKYSADEQLEQVAFYWINLHGGETAPLTVRILSRHRDVSLDLGGGNRIPKLSQRRAKSVAELRAAGVGIGRVLLAHDGTAAGSDLFQSVLTMLDSQVQLAIVPVLAKGAEGAETPELLKEDQERASQLGRAVTVRDVNGDWGPEIVRIAGEGQYDAIIVGLSAEEPLRNGQALAPWMEFILGHAPCQVFLVAHPAIPQDVSE
jgi:amino acid transporter/nucleotide-binding universal stress UspA family protein